MKRILFIDRDGTLIHEPTDNYQVDSLEKLSFLPGVITHLRRIAASGKFELVMVTNQDGLGTASFPEKDFWPAHEKMKQILAGEGITFVAEHIDRTFKHENAPTRKPGTGMLGAYFSGEYDLAHSYVIGDRHTDILLAKNLGAKGILIGLSVDRQDDAAHDEYAGTMALEANNWEQIADFLLRSGGREATVRRSTRETDIVVQVNLDGKGNGRFSTGLGFFDHMLDQLAKHSGMDLEIEVVGDLHIDEHHTIEDTGLTLGEALKKALGDKRGIHRYGHCILPMDEARAMVALDFSGRPWFRFEGRFLREKVGEMPTEMVSHFFHSFATASGCTLHMDFSGENDHHQIEALFKSTAKALRAAISRIPGSNELPTTKGML